MAIQNFVSGGFYGKLGAMIGQRWKNKRTLKAYAIPHNPRTAKQQANRSLFGGFTAVAQLGQQMNYKAPCFTSDSRTDWNQRMEQASLLKKANQSELNLIPVYPNGYTPAYTITSYAYSKKISDTEVQITIEGTLPTVSRSLSVLVGFYNETNQNYDLELYNATTTVGDTTTFNIANTTADNFTETTHLYIVSNDDSSNSDTMLFGSDMAINITVKKEVAFDTSVKSVTTSALSYDSSTDKYTARTVITFNQPWEEGTQEILNVVLYRVLAGQWSTGTDDSSSFANNNGYFSMSLTQSVDYPENINAYPEGSYIAIGSLKIETDEHILVASNTHDSITSTDLTRKFKSTVTAYSVANGVATVTMANNLHNFTRPNGSVSLYAVKAGQWTTKEFSLSQLNRTRFTFSLSATSGIDEEAAPSGSTITVGFTEIINGVTYEPYTTGAQSITEGSPTRTFNLSNYYEDADDQENYYNVPIYNADSYIQTFARGDYYEELNPFAESISPGWEVVADGSDGDHIEVSVGIAQLGYFGNVSGTFKISVTVNGVLYESDTNSYGSSDTSKTVFVVTNEVMKWSIGTEEIVSDDVAVNTDFTSITGLDIETLNTAYGDVKELSFDVSKLLISGTYTDGTSFNRVSVGTDSSFVWNGVDYDPYTELEFMCTSPDGEKSIEAIKNAELTADITIPVQNSSIANARPLVIKAFSV